MFFFKLGTDWGWSWGWNCMKLGMSIGMGICIEILAMGISIGMEMKYKKNTPLHLPCNLLQKRTEKTRKTGFLVLEVTGGEIYVLWLFQIPFTWYQEKCGVILKIGFFLKIIETLNTSPSQTRYDFWPPLFPFFLMLVRTHKLI